MAYVHLYCVDDDIDAYIASAQYTANTVAVPDKGLLVWDLGGRSLAVLRLDEEHIFVFGENLTPRLWEMRDGCWQKSYDETTYNLAVSYVLYRYPQRLAGLLQALLPLYG